MFLLVLFFCVSILFSFLCSIWEAVLLSVRPAYIEELSTTSPWVGERIQSFKKNIDQPLSAILTLNTIAHTIGAIGVGGQAAKIWAGNQVNIFGIDLSMEAIVAGLMTLAILILSEIIPKTIGATYWKGLTKFTVICVTGIVWLLYPLVWLTQWITRLIKSEGHESVLSRTDFALMADIGAREGILQKDEHRIFKNLMRFETIQAKDIMTPRTVLVAINETQTINAYYKTNPNIRFSRIPTYNKTIDAMSGYVLKDDMLEAIINNKGDQTISTLRRPFQIMEQSEKISVIFEKLLANKEHIAQLVDEYGGVAGVVTTEDIIETLFGLEIMDEYDDTADLQALARDRWKSRAKNLGIETEGKL